MSFAVYIPARFNATRLPGKLLLDVAGRPLIHYACHAALASGADRVVVATDDQRIAGAVATLDVCVQLTRRGHASGTDRIAEAAALQGEHHSAVIVNLQGDEIALPATVIRQVARRLAGQPSVDMATACAPLASADELADPHVVKVVCGADQCAMYFSRAPIPWDRRRAHSSGAPTDLSVYRRHIGIYAYRAAYLQRFTQRGVAPPEQTEGLEQLRALYHGDTIAVVEADAPVGNSIDTDDDLARARRTIAGG